MRTKLSRLKRIDVGRGHVVKRCPPSDAPLNEVHRAEIGPTNSRRVLQQALKHRVQVAGSAADDLKDFGRCGLPLQRFGQFAPESCNFPF